MTRRKSVCLQWTLVLLIVVICQFVSARPQEPSLETAPSNLAKPTDGTIRYIRSIRDLEVRNANKPAVVISLENKQNDTERVDLGVNKITLNENLTNKASRYLSNNNRFNRNKKRKQPLKDNNNNSKEINEKKKSPIRKVITKWRDKTKYDDLNSYETTVSSENNLESTKTNINADNNTENSSEKQSKRYTRPPNVYYNMYQPPSPDYPEESQVYSTGMHVMDGMLSHRPIYTSIPTPTPIITNVGYPKPWIVTRKTTTQRPHYITRPTNYQYQNNMQNYNYNNNNYEVSTFEPANSYTDRIVIRPEEYSPSAEDCPTIFLTLNNTFQGQAKEACPDLNINVNTNVINKNVVVESEEEEDSLFPAGFGLDLGLGGDDSSNDEAPNSDTNDYIGSDEDNQEQDDSASVEGPELLNYHSANGIIQSESSESGNTAAASSPLSAITKPGRPGHSDDDIFGFSALVDFFRPAFGALGWLTSVNPLSIGILPLLLAPLGFLFAGSGFAALFAPWFLPYAREAPQSLQFYKPQWRWDDTMKTWYLETFPNENPYGVESQRSNIAVKFNESIKPTVFRKVKDLMKNITSVLRNMQSNKKSFSNSRKRKKR